MTMPLMILLAWMNVSDVVSTSLELIQPNNIYYEMTTLISSYFL